MELFTIQGNELGTDASVLSRSVNDYLYAKHGITYNKAKRSTFEGKDGAAGKTTKEFQETIKDFESKGLQNILKESIDLRRTYLKNIKYYRGRWIN